MEVPKSLDTHRQEEAMNQFVNFAAIRFRQACSADECGLREMHYGGEFDIEPTTGEILHASVNLVPV